MPSSKDKPRKVIDVTEPGKSEPSASGRPIIVTNRPMLQQDPMVAGAEPVSGDEDNTPAGKVQKPETELSNLQEGHTVVPPSAPILPKEESNTAETLPDTDSIIKSADSNDSQSVSQPEEKTEDKTSDEITANKADQKSTEITAPSTEEAPTKEREAETEPKETATAAEPDDEKPTTGTDDDQLEPNKVMDEAAKKAEEEKAAKQAELEKVIESKKYYLPINAVQLRRNKLQIILLILVLIVLVLVLLDVSLDAGLLKINGIHSLTHFFSSPS